MASEWAFSQRSGHPRCDELIRRYLEEDIVLEEAVHELQVRLEQVITHSDIEEAFWSYPDSLWPALFQALSQELGTQQKLVDLVMALRALPQPQDDLEGWDLWGTRKCWKDLPLLSPFLREYYDRVVPNRTSNNPRTSGDAAAFTALNTFLARLTSGGIDMTQYGVWTLRSALEEEEEERPEANERRRLEVQTSWHVSAKAWLQLAGPQLRTCEALGQDKPGKKLRAAMETEADEGGHVELVPPTRSSLAARRWAWWRSALGRGGDGLD